jgi:hypothetical protein
MGNPAPMKKPSHNYCAWSYFVEKQFEIRGHEMADKLIYSGFSALLSLRHVSRRPVCGSCCPRAFSLRMFCNAVSRPHPRSLNCAKVFKNG